MYTILSRPDKASENLCSSSSHLFLILLALLLSFLRPQIFLLHFYHPTFLLRVKAQFSISGLCNNIRFLNAWFFHFSVCSYYPFYSLMCPSVAVTRTHLWALSLTKYIPFIYISFIFSSLSLFTSRCSHVCFYSMINHKVRASITDTWPLNKSLLCSAPYTIPSLLAL